MTSTRSAIHSLQIVFSCFLMAAASLPCFAQSGSFELVPGSLSQISVGADGAVWGVDSSQRIFTYDSATGQFVQVPGALTQITVGNANAVWGIDAQDLIFRWDSATQSWTYMPGSLMQIAVAADGDVWGVNAQNQVWHYNQQAQTWDYIYAFSNGIPVESFTQITVGNGIVLPTNVMQLAIGSGANLWGIRTMASPFNGTPRVQPGSRTRERSARLGRARMAASGA